MYHFGDITKIDGHNVPSVSIVCGGSPCQDLSLAGLRKGLAGERSGLFMDQIRIIKEMREQYKTDHPDATPDQIQPRYMVWENVCFEGETLIPCVDGYKPIKKIIEGDFVKTLSGKYFPVLKVHKTPNQPLMRVKSMSGELLCTPNHPFYAKIGNSIDWVPAFKLTPNHLIGHKLDRVSESTPILTYEDCKNIGLQLGGIEVDKTYSYLIHNGEIPQIMYGLSVAHQKEFLRGYVSAVSKDDAFSITAFKDDISVLVPSQSLALGLARIFRNCFKVKVQISKLDDLSKVYYFVVAKMREPALESNGILWEPVEEVENTDITTTVYNLSVMEDNTYAPYDIIVHNCGALSSNKGEDFRAVLEETCRVVAEETVIPGPPKGKWQPSGAIVADWGSIAYKVHNSQFWGVPQRRRRISLVADFGGCTAPEILFDLESVLWNSEQSNSQKQSPSDNSGEGSEGAITDVSGYDVYNFAETGDVGRTLSTPSGGLNEHIPVIAQKADGVVSKGDGNVFLSEDHHMSLACGGGQAGQGYPCVLYSLPVDVYNGKIPEDGAVPTICTSAAFPDSCSGKVIDCKIEAPHSICYGISSMDSNGMKSDNPNVGFYEADTSKTLDNNGGNPACNQGGTVVAQVIAIEGNGQRESHKGNGYSEEDTMYTLNTVEHHAVAYKERQILDAHLQDTRMKICEDNISPALTGTMGTGGNNGPMVLDTIALGHSGHMTRPSDDVAHPLEATDYKDPQAVCYGCSWDGGDVSPTLTKCNANGAQRMPDKDNFNAIMQSADNVHYVVRRLTPLECERLQGFPDFWTSIGEWVDENGKKHKESDSPRFRALGNSIALPFWKLLAKKMCEYIEHPTMASLFDGIAGFPLSFYEAGCTPVWASEIEPFCIAVSKRHFGDDENGLPGDVDNYLKK